MGKKKNKKKKNKKKKLQEEVVETQEVEEVEEIEEIDSADKTSLDFRIDEIKERLDEFVVDLEKSPSNAAAARRARKHTTALAVIFKDFRKESLDAHRK